MTDVRPSPMSQGEVGWGILATGGIANAFTRDLVAHGHRVAAVGSRSADNARAFAGKWGIEHAHGSYDELVADPDVDIVYVATPHNFHAANATAALENGKHVLVEKAFTVNAAEARAVFQLGRSKGLLVMEAMWTRFLPHMAYVRSVIERGLVGDVRSLHADHTQRLPSDPAHRLNNLDLAGGCLLDVGVYPVSFAHDILGDPAEVTGRGTLRDTGVDVCVATVMRHRNDAVSTTYSSMETRGPNTAVVLGTEGRIEIDEVWYFPAAVTVKNVAGQELERFDEPVTGRGMQYQAAEAERLIAEGEMESPLMTHEQSVAVMTTMDAVREEIGVRYPGE
ncbi:Gfo/Idh/MocA family oxidoreductase [Nonomuraea mesophila]|uniref:Gfo/Idh/MocA family oxidoreductase n=1 Tax=Nonomuraea mesophila TaxID=2530382 RepID=A0A4R5F6D9_9ACTN|nr:Gfo/Idh/MocA family oxidoreductase [Nonomuraea mesophila]TDE43414.1 Gfo/Idh/MocA family oxidoreductase [Nonomuraea mesophila]